MKKIIFVLIFVFAGALTAMAQDWSEYSRGSSEWHKMNRGAMTRPWKYDRAGRLRRGNSYRQHSARRRS